MSLIIIPCGARKLYCAAPAAQLYCGPYFRACLKFARALTPDENIRILSARYGLVRLSMRLKPYDQKLRPSSVPELTQRVLDWAPASLLNSETVVALCGSPYNRVVRKVWPQAAFPLLDAEVGGIGKQLAWFKNTDPEAIRRKYLEEVPMSKERPIIFGAEMVKAILAGRKTQTRRPLKPQPQTDAMHHWASYGCWVPDADMIGSLLEKRVSDACSRHPNGHHRCPYGDIGERLWVREAWRFPSNVNNFSPAELQFRWAGEPLLCYEGDSVMRGEMARATTSWGCLRNAMFMPRWASRILLEITDVRVERVQKISSCDALAEGIDAYDASDFPDPVGAFHELWDSIHNKSGHDWELNPWVWALSFKLLEAKP